jgi:ABC-type amino acid transport substrate-binding protein
VDELVGVEIDILGALASRLGMKTRIVPVVWDGIEAGLLEKKYDVILNAWVPSTKTPAGIVATDPYNEWGLLVVVRSDDTAIRSFADLAGKTVGHFEDPSVDRSIISLRPAQRVPFEDSDQLFAALAAGKLDAAVEDSTYVRWRVAHEAGLRVVGGPLNRIGYRIGVRAEDRALLPRVNAAIKEMRDSGELARIRTRWEGADAPGR